MADLKAFITLDFQKQIPASLPTREDVLDTRNFIYARNPTFTKESYLGYLNFVKSLAMTAASDANNYMLRLGFIPLVMPPSFWGDRAHTMILPHIPKSLPYYPRPATSFLNSRYHSDYPDIWVSKLDAAKLCGCKPELVTVKGVLEKCGL